MDSAERDFIAAEKITCIPVNNVGENPGSRHSINAESATQAYIHIDFDVLDRREFPWVGCPTPEGLSIDTLRLAPTQIDKRFDVVRLSAVEISADHQEAEKAANTVQKLLAGFSQAGFWLAANPLNLYLHN